MKPSGSGLAFCSTRWSKPASTYSHRRHVGVRIGPLVGAPGADLGVLVRGEVVKDQVEALVGPAAAQGLEEGQELAPAFAVTDAVVPADARSAG